MRLTPPGVEAVSAEKTPQVHEELSRLSDMVGAIGNLTMELIGGLDHVLSPEMVEALESKRIEGPPMAPLALNIRDQTERLVIIMQRIESVLRRLQV